jgi:hypothetical protein
MSKVLRLAGVLPGEDVYRLARQNDLPRLCELIERNGLVEQYHSAMRSFTCRRWSESAAFRCLVKVAALMVLM